MHADTRCSSRPGACRPRGLTRLAKACSMLNTDGRCASNIACAMGAAPGRGFLALRPAGSDYLPAQPGGGERVVAASDALPETKPGSGERARGGVGYGGKQQTCGSLSINAKTALDLLLG